MTAEKIISRLEKVKRTGNNQWIACCPHHADRSPSMTIRELDDGRILLHCFAGCPPNDVLASIGLTFSDLFPESLGDLKRERRPFNAHDILAAIAFEVTVVKLLAANMRKGYALNNLEMQRLNQASKRIAQAEDFANGK